MKTICAVIGFLLLASTLPAQQSRLYDARRSRLLQVASKEMEKSPYIIAAKVHEQADVSTAMHLLDSLTADRAMGGMFYCYSLIGTYLYTEHSLPDSLKRKVRLAYGDRMMYRGDTENHWVMYYTGLYLAAQTWPGEGGETWFNGKSSSENFCEAAEWLHHWIETTATVGQGEFDSPTYFITFAAPMTVLYEFAADPVMKTKAQMMLDLLFADFAAEHLKGNYGGGHSRDYPEDIINPLAASSTLWAWLYFGEPGFEQWEEARFRPRNRGGWESVFGALSSYRLPAIIGAMASDRTVPYVHTETKRVRNVIRFGTEKSPPVYKYTYVTKDYILGSLHGGILQPIQQHTWDITIASGKPYNTIFTLHPYFSGRELGMFFPEEIQFLADEVDRYHKVYTNPDKWNASSPYEKTLQWRNTLLVLYTIEEGAKHPHIDGFFPKNLDMREEFSGWILCKSGETFVALYFLRPGTWIEEKVNWRWRSDVLNNGVIVEAGSETEDGSLDAFKKSLLTAKIDHELFRNTTTIRYVNRHGRRMELSPDGGRIIDGKQINLTDYRLFDGPFIESDYRSGVITLRHGKDRRILDFRAAAIREESRE